MGGFSFLVSVGGGQRDPCSQRLRKIAEIESYAPTDNVSELTARVNDDGWETSFSRWLQGSHLREGDALLVFSVGGGNLEKNVSANIVRAVELAQKVGAKITGIVGRDGGYTAKVAGCGCGDSDNFRRHCDSSRRKFPGRGLASNCFRSTIEGARDEVGVNEIGRDRIARNDFLAHIYRFALPSTDCIRINIMCIAGKTSSPDKKGNERSCAREPCCRAAPALL